MHWSRPMWEHKGLGLADPVLPETSQLCHEVLSLPMSAETPPGHVEIVADAIRLFFACR